MSEPAAAVATQLQSEISAKTAAAVQETGFGKEFDSEVDAAIARDPAAVAVKDGKAPPATPEPPKPPVVPARPAEKPAPTLDIPDALLGDKKVETPKDT